MVPGDSGGSVHCTQLMWLALGGCLHCWPIGLAVECLQSGWATLGDSGHCGFPPGLAPPASH